MINKFLKYIYYSVYDVIKILLNLFLKNNFIIIYPRIVGIILNNIKIYDKSNKKFFNFKVRNYSDILTVYEIFSEENYNLKKYFIFDKVNKYYNENLNNNKVPIIIDCGSNIGASSVYFSKIFNKSKIALIEPDYESFIFSKKNFSENNFTFFNFAISNKKDTVKFLSDKKDNRASRVSNSGNISIECHTVDEILRIMDEPDGVNFLIKIDIEGHENKLFENNYDWLDSFKIVIIEIHDWMLPNKSNSLNFLSALVSISQNKRKRDLIISGENLISIRIDEQ